MSRVASYGGAAYGGSRTPGPGGRGGDALLVPGYNAAYTISSRGSGRSAYGRAAFGGRRTVARPAAGLFAVPDPDSGAVTVPWWAAFVETATITRVDGGGARTPVRGGEAMAPAGPWRRNPSSNPIARDSADGYVGGANTTVSRTTDRPQPAPLERVTTAVRGTAAAAGAATIVTSLDPTGPMTTTFAAALRTSVVATALRLQVAWYDRDSTLISTSTYPVPDAVRTAAGAAAQWGTVTVDTWPSGAVLGVVSWSATGLPAGGWLEVTARISEVGAALTGPWFDGDSLAAAWIGTPGLSHSAQGALATLVDAEAPLDTDLVYELTLSTLPGWVARSEPVRLESEAVFGRGTGDRWRSRRRCLLTHPGQARTMPAWVQDAPEVSNDLEQEAHALPGRRRKVVVSADVRSGDEGEIVFITESREERARLLELLDDGSPLLVRLPPALQYPPLWWLAFGSLSTEALERSGRVPVRKLTVPFIEVDRPAVATRALAA